MDDMKTEIDYNCRQFPFLIFRWKNAENMRYEVEDTNTETDL